MTHNYNIIINILDKLWYNKKLHVHYLVYRMMRYVYRKLYIRLTQLTNYVYNIIIYKLDDIYYKRKIIYIHNLVIIAIW